MKLVKIISYLFVFFLAFLTCKKEDDNNPIVESKELKFTSIMMNGVPHTKLKYDEMDRLTDFYMNGKMLQELYGPEYGMDILYHIYYRGNGKEPYDVKFFMNNVLSRVNLIRSADDKVIVSVMTSTGNGVWETNIQFVYSLYNKQIVSSETFMKMNDKLLSVKKDIYQYEGMNLVKKTSNYLNSNGEPIAEVFAYEYEDDAKNPFHKFGVLPFVLDTPAFCSVNARTKITKYINGIETEVEIYKHTVNEFGYIKEMKVTDGDKEYTLNYVYE
ncbi:MAG: hypothetical protein ACEPOW_02735 [Bacteroidales bacterium]